MVWAGRPQFWPVLLEAPHSWAVALPSLRSPRCWLVFLKWHLSLGPLAPASLVPTAGPMAVHPGLGKARPNQQLIPSVTVTPLPRAATCARPGPGPGTLKLQGLLTPPALRTIFNFSRSLFAATPPLPLTPVGPAGQALLASAPERTSSRGCMCAEDKTNSSGSSAGRGAVRADQEATLLDTCHSSC